MLTTHTVALTVRFEAENPDAQAALDALVDHVNTIAYVSGVEMVRSREDTPSMNTYSIVRFHQDGPTETVVRGLSLEQAQAHCQRDDTHGPGWFDGFRME